MGHVVVGCGALNNWSWTKRFLDSIHSEDNYVEIVVVDQASDAATKAALHAYEHPLGYRVTKRFNAENTGCAGAWNAIVRAVWVDRDEGTPHGSILICGNDVELMPHTIDALAKAQDRSGIPVVSGCETNQRHVDPCMEVGRINFNAFMLSPLVSPYFEGDLFDEQFQPIYFEDNDFHWRLLEQGLEGCVVNDATFRHGGSMTMKTGGIQQQVSATFEGNKAKWQAKHRHTNVNDLHVPRSRRSPIGTREEICSAQALRRWERYARLCHTKSDINEHLPTLLKLAYECEHVTEMGVRWATSTTALLHAQPANLECYDVYRDAQVDEVHYPWDTYPEVESVVAVDRGMEGRTHMRFHLADVLTVDIDETDMLFIDTRHTYAQLKAELERHSSKVRSILAFHDTILFGQRGEDGGPGLRPAIDEFLAAHPEWRVDQEFTNNNGLLVARRS